MAFNPQRLKKAFYSFSGIFKRQSAFGTALLDSDLDKRHNCTVEFEDVVETETIYDCSGEDIYAEETLSQLKRIRITYATITPQILFGWIAVLLSSATSPTGTPANEVQTATNADIDGGSAPMTFEFEGKTGTTDAIAYDADASVFQAALEGLDSIGEGNVEVAGSLSTGLAATFKGDLAKTDVPLITFGTGFTDGGTPVSAPVFVETTKGSNKKHTAVRSTDDQLAKISMGAGYSGNSTDPNKFRDLVGESVAITVRRRGNASAVVTLLGRFTPEQMESYTVPDCENLSALKGRDCKIKIDSTYLHDEFWFGTLTLNNATPTGEDAFPFDDVEVGNLERGDKPTYPISLQILGSEGDTIGEICRLRQKKAVEFHFGLPGNRCSVILPNVAFKFASNPRVFVGERNRSAHNIDAVPHKDDTLKTPLKAEANLDQTDAFLST